ncbi:MAG: hypothetical protein WDO74_11590 [Pseudomonadota bacterium]
MSPGSRARPLLVALCLLGLLLGGVLLFFTHKNAAPESVAAPPSGMSIAAASAPNASPPAPLAPPAVEPQAPAASTAPADSAAPVAASASPRAVLKVKAKLASVKSKSAGPQPAAPAIDPLDGRR